MNNALKLADFFESELDLDKEVILAKSKLGKYSFFGNYFIVPTDNGCFKVLSTKNDVPVEFSTLKTATAWCILHNAGNFYEANRIHVLDLKLCSMNMDFTIHKKLIKTAETTFSKQVYAVKLQEDTHKRRLIIQEINKHINTSKKIQENNFRKKVSKFRQQ